MGAEATCCCQEEVFLYGHYACLFQESSMHSHTVILPSISIIPLISILGVTER